jgi:hypothetical protein
MHFRIRIQRHPRRTSPFQRTFSRPAYWELLTADVLPAVPAPMIQRVLPTECAPVPIPVGIVHYLIVIPTRLVEPVIGTLQVPRRVLQSCRVGTAVGGTVIAGRPQLLKLLQAELTVIESSLIEVIAVVDVLIIHLRKTAHRRRLGTGGGGGDNEADREQYATHVLPFPGRCQFGTFIINVMNSTFNPLKLLSLAIVRYPRLSESAHWCESHSLPGRRTRFRMSRRGHC